MQNKNKEHVLFEGTVKNENPNLKINEQHATMDIAKSLIQDFTFIVTIACIKTVFVSNSECEKLMSGLKDVWTKRTSAQLAEETKKYEDAIFHAFENQTSVSAETTEKMNNHLKTYCNVRDNAVAGATNAVDDIIKMICEKKEENKENENV